MSAIPIMVENKVLIIRDVQEEVTKGGILISQVQRERGNTGTIVAVGPGTIDAYGKYKPMVSQIGDTVIIPDGGMGRQISIDREKFLVCKESEIPCILRTESEENPDV